MWDYIYYICFISEKNPIEHNGEESYVYRQFLNDNTSWIPFQRCKEINLNGVDEDEKEIMNIGYRALDNLDETATKYQGLIETVRELSVQKKPTGTKRRGAGNFGINKDRTVRLK